MDLAIRDVACAHRWELVLIPEMPVQLGCGKCYTYLDTFIGRRVMTNIHTTVAGFTITKGGHHDCLVGTIIPVDVSYRGSSVYSFTTHQFEEYMTVNLTPRGAAAIVVELGPGDVIVQDEILDQS